MRLINRRAFIAGAVGATVSGCAPAVVPVIAATAEMTATSFLYTKFFDVAKSLLSSAISGSVGNYTYDHLNLKEFDVSNMSFFPTAAKATETPAPHKVSWDEFMALVDEQGLDGPMSVKLANTIGLPAAYAALQSQSPLLIQHNQRPQQVVPANIFYIDVDNRTSKDIGGQLTFKVVDQQSGQIDHTFTGSSIIVPAGTKRLVPIYSKFNFGKAGMKNIEMLDWPLNLQVQGAPVNVLPVLVR